MRPHSEFIFSLKTLPPFTKEYSDALAATFLALLSTLTRSKIFIFIIMVFVALGASGNIDHILINAANMNAQHSRYAMDSSFLMGSVMNGGVLYRAVIILGAILIVSYLMDCSRLKVGWVFKSSVATILMFSVFLNLFNMYGTNPLYKKWLQSNFVVENIIYAAESLIPLKATARQKRFVPPKELTEEIESTFYQSDYSGSPIVKYPTPDERPNIIVIAVEGMSRQHLYSGYTPFLDELGSQGLLYDNFITNQRITTNGMYTLWCGDYPNLISLDTKSEVLEARGEIAQCLPAQLKMNGYSTYFIQSANIDYMDKDKLAEAVGIDNIYGAENMPIRNSNNGWGVSDKDLFDSTSLLLDELEGIETSFFITMLNIGTHHPYPNLPQEYVKRFNDHSKAAFFNVDLLIKQFFGKLAEKNLLNNTVVVITSDESAFNNSSNKLPEGYLPNSNGLLVVHTPKRVHKRIKAPFSQRDLFFSFSDYLGSPTYAVGKSIFRDYQNFSPQIFSNVFTNSISCGRRTIF
jgi:phosphoglycerol transferase MdoB-like AlkP superfamily enzyme